MHAGESLRAKPGNLKIQEVFMKENVSGRHKLLQCLCIKQKEKNFYKVKQIFIL